MKNPLCSLFHFENIFSQRLLSLLLLLSLCMSSLHAQDDEVNYKYEGDGHLVRCNVGYVNDDGVLYCLRAYQRQGTNYIPVLGFSFSEMDLDKLKPYHKKLEEAPDQRLEISIKITLTNGEIISSQECTYSNTSFSLLEDLIISFSELKSNRKNIKKDTREHISYIATQLSTYDIKSIEALGQKHNFYKVKTAKIYKKLFDVLASKTKLVWYPSKSSTSNSNTQNSTSSNSYNSPVNEFPLTIEGSTSYVANIAVSGTGEAGIAYAVRTKTGKLVSNAGLSKFTATTDVNWARIIHTSDAGFLLVVDPNNSGSARSAIVTVSLDGHSTQMIVTQTSSPITIKNVWTEFDQWRNTQKGMVIHTSFSVNGVRGQQGNISAYFRFQNGNKLQDYNSNYGTVDGQVSTWSTFVPAYDATDFNDFQLFIPYAELHTQGVVNLMYCVTVTISGQSQSSNYYNFTVR